MYYAARGAGRSLGFRLTEQIYTERYERGYRSWLTGEFAGAPDAGFQLLAKLALLHGLRPNLKVDGEMQADTAVLEGVLQRQYPFNRLHGPANVLIFPDLNAANICYKLLGRLGGAQAIGPILVGLAAPVHVLERDSGVDDIVNMAVIAAVDAQERGRRRAESPSIA